MNILDLIILLPIAYFVFRGFSRGIIREILSLVGIILAVFITFRYMDPVSGLISPLFDESSDIVPLVAGILLFIVTLLCVHLCTLLLEKFMKVLHLNFLNRISGALFGGLKSAVVISACLLLLAGFNTPGEETRNSSLTYAYILYLAPGVYNAIATVYPGAENFITTIEETLQETNPIKELPIFNP